MAGPDLPRRIAADLLTIRAVILAPDDPFTWSSGLRAPIYCDNRLTLSYPTVRRTIASGFEEQLHHHELAPQVIVGTATAGIPHAAWLADRLDLPMAYVRSEAKAHGRGNQIEGIVEPGQNAVVVEDLISTGGSSLAVVEALRSAGANVLALLAIFTYGFAEARQRFEQAQVPVYTLTDFDTLLSVAIEQDLLDSSALDTLRSWRQNPRAWSEQHAPV